ncbi:hypothetical protein DB30_05520 [Enhygromyxa salina]|uniref:Exo-alpha-sialidase n=1 Tax=Enhygromyxa salina TaxID=215803 RepID=A0A0C2D625_9BACT|nr:hypothetical protein [Enhygromyxa salina]KIG15497.1 hypothetical protein DB30_05520 [Enhygromyxa salina]
MPSSALEQAELQLLWSLDEGTDHARRGHAYVFAEPQRARWVSLEHSPSATPHMLELLARWQAAHPPSEDAKLRRMTHWADPAGRWRFHGDLGGVRELLGTLPLVHELGDASASSLPELPEAFVREPIGCLVRAQLGPLDWPAALEAPQVCVGPLGLVSAREHTQVVVCAARPGSIHAGSGQTRTAAVWRSEDEGRSWAELGWELDPDHEQPRAWPPEQVEGVRLDAADVVIEWDDPWIDWESGDQWRGVFVHADQRWRVSTRD